jgi:peptidoglycan/xylan/chitin deacetylase (PgdA/CDA1 family)
MPHRAPSRHHGTLWMPLASLLILVIQGCSRKSEAPPPAPTQAAAEAPAWTWYGLGNLVVLEGEVGEETDLLLEGRSIRHTLHAEFGPVRWELLRPPQGEVATLRDGQGRVLGRFTFQGDHEPTPAPLKVAKAKARHPEPPAPTGAKAVPPSRPAPVPVAKPAPEPRPEPVRVAAVPASLKAGRALPGPVALTPAEARAVSPEAARPVPPPVPLPASAASWPGKGEALNLTQGSRGARRILLSFDGGSNSEGASEILDALKARGIRTTLFLTGTFIRKFPALVRRMAAEGHELGNHTTTHPHFAPGMVRDPKWTKERIQEELLSADRALVELLGRPMDPVWRAPYGEHTAEIRRWVEEIGYRHVGWSEGADSLDWATPKERKLYRSGDAVMQRLQARIQKDGSGLIVLMHLGSDRDEHDRPSGKLGAFIDRAQAAGYTFVTASELLNGLGKPAWDRTPRLALLQRGGSAGAR